MISQCPSLPFNFRSMIAAASISVGVLTAAASPAMAQVTLTYATYFNSNDPLVQVDTWFMEEVEKRTNGNVTFDTYFSGTMLGGPDIYPGLTRGAIDVGMSVPAAFQPSEYVLSNVTLPYITDNSVAVTYAFNQLLQQSDALQKEYANQNIKLFYALGFSENEIWSNSPIHNAEDLKELRIRSVMSIANALEMLGAVPVSMGFGDSVSALQRQVIDGFSSAPFLSSISVGIQDVAPYVSDGGGMGVYAVSSTGINLDKWNSIPSKDQEIIEQVISEIPDHYAKLIDPLVEEGIVKLKEAGKTQVIRMSDDEKARIRGIVAEPLWNAWLDRVKSSGVTADGQEFLNSYRQLVEKAQNENSYVPALDRYVQKYGN
jgi:TRAP-type C4-dicarboxylate transport system substrate-binding protein